MRDPAANGEPVVGKAGEKGALMSPGYASVEARRQYVLECGKGMDLLSVVAIAQALDYWRKPIEPYSGVYFHAMT